MEAEHTHTLGLMAAIIYATRGTGELSAGARRELIVAAVREASVLLAAILWEEDAPAAEVA